MIVIEQRCCGHDHAGLAIAALGQVFRYPGLLHGMAAIARVFLFTGPRLAGDRR